MVLSFKLLSHFNQVLSTITGPVTREEKARKVYIINVILIGTIILGFAAVLVNIIRSLQTQDPISELLPGVTLLFLYGLYIMSKHVSSQAAALILVGVSSILAYYLAYQWGTTIPQSWIILALTIVMGGILISSRFSLFLILVHTVTLLTLTYLQIKGAILYQSWDISPMYGSIIVAVVTLTVIGLITWLSNREIDKALKRARGSEKALKKERDLLEVRVEERTKELKKAHLEKMFHLYRFADFGRLASGLFHDLVNPLTTVSLNLETLSARDTSPAVRRAVRGAKQMRRFVNSIKKQIQKQEVKTSFILCEEIKQAIDILDHKANEAKVKVHFVHEIKVRNFGNPTRFNQLVTNLVSNATDSYQKVKRRKNREIIVRLVKSKNIAILTVQDFGSGIPKKNLNKLFDPFFTTKSIEQGTGLGLSICKDIVEKEFGGKIKVESKEGEGSTFIVEFPLKKRF